MPRYDYACTHCEHGFEVIQAFTDDALTVCPQCGGRLRKVFGSVGVVFKGSGFYRNDSRSTATTAVAAKGDASPNGSVSESSSESSTDSTPSDSKSSDSSSAKPKTDSKPATASSSDSSSAA